MIPAGNQEKYVPRRIRSESRQRSRAVRMRSGHLKILRRLQIHQHYTKQGMQTCMKRLGGLGHRFLRFVLTCPGQTCSSDLSGSSSETTLVYGLTDQLGDSSEMTTADDLDVMFLGDGNSLTDARHPDKFLDYGGSSGSRMGKQSEHGRRSNILSLLLKGYICILS
ncbi:hypothetical protein ACP4OV_025206 [Aristida adscensionis]